MLKAIADTHAIIWYIEQNPRLSELDRSTIDDAANSGDHIGVSSITLVEMTYLIEKARIVPGVYEKLRLTLAVPTAVFREYPCDHEVALALRNVPRAQVPDMPDRIIAATAVRFGVPCISRDGKIQLSQVPTVW
jgi:PIN domain nuclease of toxin-antitoxin system